MAQLRQDQIRSHVQRFFQTAMDRYLELMNSKGLTDELTDWLAQEKTIHETALTGDVDVSDMLLDHGMIESFTKYSDLSAADFADNKEHFRRELRKGRRDQIAAALRAAESLENYHFDQPAPSDPQSSAAPPSAALGASVDAFLSECSREFPVKTVEQYRSYLGLLVEHFGPDRPPGDDIQAGCQYCPGNPFRTACFTEDKTRPQELVAGGCHKGAGAQEDGLQDDQ